MLSCKNLKASIEGKKILKGASLEVNPGELHVLMGPNGSGKSTLAQVIAGHPSYKIESGELRFEISKINKLTPDKRAKLGIFLAFQHPVEIPGVSMFNVLRKARHSTNGKIKSASLFRNSVANFRSDLIGYAKELKLGEEFIRRSLNEGFSGGEKKRSEILQMMALEPKLVILDEIDSGLDVDGLKIVATAVKKYTRSNPQSSVLLITHYARILKYLKPDFVHIMMDGKIIKSGKANLAKQIEEKGYQKMGREVQYYDRV
ncbi:Fe-S cluster assembly ATPase SufC [Candidatus Curtissbacteria bacterium RIFCSPHIGHO2_02_FULL_42_15]|uniref:Fe-S cluster assembly ATPase SufC n=1 Tax=Candidatus Curtissbacteria bacterium RIFCSPHIGHO2_02_FULL_42_15 TaxID=1797716 RepID=A0A1F5GFN8_9BACT|nr:MAG: Fe-S cluster assembly ATPase SufC [Candidatus Curtissbacteria bacterium RIFCSPHIGHO2_02_FULL_42_15]